MCPTNKYANHVFVHDYEERINVMRALSPGEIAAVDIFDGRRYCVYQHWANGFLFYAGSGQIARAFEFESTRRCPAWQAYASGKTVSVILTHRSNDRNEMRRAEYELIRRWRPFGNEALDHDQPAEWREVRRDDICVATLLDRVTAIRIHHDTLSSFQVSTVAAASNMTGVSRSAIYNSLSGRHGEVRGYRFERVDIRLTGP